MNDPCRRLAQRVISERLIDKIPLFGWNMFEDHYGKGYYA